MNLIFHCFWMSGIIHKDSENQGIKQEINELYC